MLILATTDYASLSLGFAVLWTVAAALRLSSYAMTCGLYMMGLHHMQLAARAPARGLYSTVPIG